MGDQLNNKTEVSKHFFAETASQAILWIRNMRLHGEGFIGLFPNKKKGCHFLLGHFAVEDEIMSYVLLERKFVSI